MQLQGVSLSEKFRLCNESWNEVGTGLAETIPRLRQSSDFLGLLQYDVREPLEFHVVLILCCIFLLVGADSLAHSPRPGLLSGAGFWSCKLSQALVEKWSRASLLEFLQSRGFDCDDGMVHLSLRGDG